MLYLNKIRLQNERYLTLRFCVIFNFKTTDLKLEIIQNRRFKLIKFMNEGAIYYIIFIFITRCTLLHHEIVDYSDKKLETKFMGKGIFKPCCIYRVKRTQINRFLNLSMR